MLLIVRTFKNSLKIVCGTNGTGADWCPMSLNTQSNAAGDPAQYMMPACSGIVTHSAALQPTLGHDESRPAPDMAQTSTNSSTACPPAGRAMTD